MYNPRNHSLSRCLNSQLIPIVAIFMIIGALAEKEKFELLIRQPSAPGYVSIKCSTDTNGNMKTSVSYLTLRSALPVEPSFPESAFEDAARVTSIPMAASLLEDSLVMDQSN
ncbi:hypothetical protein BJ085DRAFT_32272 [Dimargaris cristalligena]|uniref:Uncharacterized protein n=1 Tax=Dimargaris cristalligena TaxID=215637 RepID=A0A4P9ZJG8_9FUNG|nr:hypothetical protein BJ085DRAFT_32272 [Dimargaris cristalligena]|eukprot:RKP33357.1 hypothetical protein BJ085DRAFT_32272 [Dimargaris cristalligena]